MGVIGSTRSPGHDSGAGPCDSVPEGACIEGGTAMSGDAAPGLAPPARYGRRSFLVTRPAIPLPCMAVISRPCSAAILRTSGDERVRMRSSKLFPFPEGVGAVGAAAVGCEGAAERVLPSLFGGGSPAELALAAAAAGAPAGTPAPAVANAALSVSN